MSLGKTKKYGDLLRFHEMPKAFTVDGLSGGISLDGGCRRALRRAENMMAADGGIVTASAPEAVQFDLPDGEIQGSLCRGGLWLFGKGNCLFALCDGVLRQVGEDGLLADGPCGIYETDRGFAVVSGETVFFVDRSLQVTFPEMAVPVLMDGLNENGEHGVEAEKPNFFCPYIDLIYQSSNTGAGSVLYKIPEWLSVCHGDVRVFDADTGQEVTLYLEKMRDGCVVVPIATARRLRIRLRLSASGAEGKFSFASMASRRAMLASAREPSVLTLPTARLSYAICGGANEQSLQVLTLNGEEDFCSLSESRLLTYPMAERVTAVTEYGEGLLVFTEGAIRRCRFALADGVLTPELTLIKGDFGSDVPKSICKYDDKVIFASSIGGIFYLKGYGGADREVCYHVSRPIEGGEEGLFAHGTEAIRGASAICTGGKYYLCVEGMTYIWDMTAKPPRAAAGGGEERDTVFTLMTAAAPREYLAAIGQTVYYTDGEQGGLWRLSPTYDRTADIPSSLETAESDLCEKRRKVLLSVGVEYDAVEEVTLSLIYDGEQSPMALVLPKTEGRRRRVLRLPQSRFHRMAVRLSSEKGLSLYGLELSFLPAEL